MIQYSCDLCGRHLDAEEDQRFVVKIEIVQAFDPVDGIDADEDRDYLQEIHDALEHLDGNEDGDPSDEVVQNLRFDLCAECRRKFAKNPLGREPKKHFNFSQN